VAGAAGRPGACDRRVAGGAGQGPQTGCRTRRNAGLWPDAAYDLVAAIFIQFAPPPERDRIIAGIRRCLKPGGLLILQGYTPKQIEFGTGGPPHAANMYTADLLRDWFGDWDILHLAEHESVISEGSHHHGMSALIDLVARKP